MKKLSYVEIKNNVLPVISLECVSILLSIPQADITNILLDNKICKYQPTELKFEEFVALYAHIATPSRTKNFLMIIAEFFKFFILTEILKLYHSVWVPHRSGASR